MSIWADRQIHALNAKVSELEKRLESLEGKPQSDKPSALPPPDKRTKEFREWKNGNL